MATPKKPRSPLAGYPIEQPFASVDAVRDYLSEPTIRCLRCGRRFKSISSHLKSIHEMTADQYREMYCIPWTYGLASPDTSDAISRNSQKLVAAGIICKDRDASRMYGAAHRPVPPTSVQVKASNLAEVNKGCTGKEARRRAAAAKRGSPEHIAKLRARPFCNLPETKEFLRTLWVGKKRNGERGKMVSDGPLAGTIAHLWSTDDARK